MNADKSEIDDYKNIIKDNTENKQIFFESIFNTSNPLDIPFEMKDSDFEKFNQIAKSNNKTKLSYQKFKNN